jgi:hypothetical protein
VKLLSITNWVTNISVKLGYIDFGKSWVLDPFT